MTERKRRDRKVNEHRGKKKERRRKEDEIIQTPELFGRLQTPKHKKRKLCFLSHFQNSNYRNHILNLISIIKFSKEQSLYVITTLVSGRKLANL